MLSKRAIKTGGGGPGETCRQAAHAVALLHRRAVLVVALHRDLRERGTRFLNQATFPLSSGSQLSDVALNITRSAHVVAILLKLTPTQRYVTSVVAEGVGRRQEAGEGVEPTSRQGILRKVRLHPSKVLGCSLLGSTI